MRPSQVSRALRCIAASADSVHPSRHLIAASLNLVLALIREDDIPEEVLKAFQDYLEDAMEDYAYVDKDDFLGYLDFLGLLDRIPKLQDLDWKANGLPFG